MDGLVELSPYALTTRKRAMSYIGRGEAAEGEAETWVPVLVNAATGRIERPCGRRLAARTHRASVSIPCTATADDAPLAGPGFLAPKTLDDALGVKLAAGSRVDSI